MNRQDDPALVGDIILLRRIPATGGRVQWDGDIPVPSSQNFRDARDELSVYIANETTPELAFQGHDGFGLVSITVQHVRDAYAEFHRLVVICRDDENPANGHVLICGKATPGIARRLKEFAQWVPGKWPARDQSNPT